jgi:hypothetical protein
MMRAQGLSSGAPLRASDRVALALEIVVAYVQARRAIRRDLREALRILRASSDGVGPEPADALAVGRRLGRAVRRTLSMLPVDSRCLMTSLVLTRLLAARGIDSQLVISVSPGEKFGAHAWIEHDGAALLPPEASEEARLTTQ